MIWAYRLALAHITDNQDAYEETVKEIPSKRSMPRTLAPAA